MNEAKRLKELESENSKLKRLLAEKMRLKGCRLKKVVKSASKKRVVEHLISAYKLSERLACKLVGLSRTAYRYKPKQRDYERVITRLKELALEYPRYGYLLLHGLLKREGLVKNKKRTCRLYTE